jgi:Recombinase zinc beta ribbon domain/Recombinase
LEHSRVLGILHNPRYTGAFVYGRTRQRKVAIGGQLRYRRLKREEWSVFLPNMYPGYISWEEFESNQAKLLANANGYSEDRRKSPPREGSALLQGLVICGVCGLRMTVRYHTDHGHSIPDYVCQRRGIQTAEPLCQRLPGAQIDQAVTELVLKAVNRSSLDVALAVFEELRTRKAEIDRLRRTQVERAREEAELAQRQYLLARPENRLVVDHLERQWNEKLTSLTQAEEEYARMSKSQPSALTDADRNRIHALASDLPRVWNDPRTPARDRKRMLRLVIEDVTLVKKQNIQIHVRWKAGATTSIERPLPLSAPDLVRYSCGHRRTRPRPRHRTNGCSDCADSQRALSPYRPEALFYTANRSAHSQRLWRPICVQYLRSQGLAYCTRNCCANGSALQHRQTLRRRRCAACCPRR